MTIKTKWPPVIHKCENKFGLRPFGCIIASTSMGLKKIKIEPVTHENWKLKRSHGDITAIYNKYKDSDTPIGRSAIKDAFKGDKANPTVINLITEFYEKAI